MDVTTCKPLPNVMVEIWSRKFYFLFTLRQPLKKILAANAQGNYGATFLRGAFPSGSNGIAEFQTIFPGFTSEGANHINLMVYTSSSTTSSVAHIGQVFFTDKWTTIIGLTSPYNANTHARVTNLDDAVYTAANNAGFYPVVE